MAARRARLAVVCAALAIAGIDLYNLLNANTGTGFNQNFGSDGATWLRPNAVLNPRYVRFNATVDF